MFEFSRQPQIQPYNQPMLGTLAPINPVVNTTRAIEDLKSQFQMIKSAANPNAMLQQMAAQNPEIMKTMNYVNSAYNGNGEQAFMAEAKAKGMNDQQIKDFLSALQ